MKFNSLFSALGFNSVKKDKTLEYSEWIKRVEQPSLSLKYKAESSDKLLKLSVVLISDPSERNKVLLKQSIGSLLSQLSSNWELLIIGTPLLFDASLIQNNNIKVIEIEGKPNFFKQANIAVQSAKGDFVTFISAGDQLSKYTTKVIIAHNRKWHQSKLIVTDEDLIDDEGNRYNPFFKPDWNPDYLEGYNYFSKAVAFDREFFVSLDGFEHTNTDPYHNLYLRATNAIPSSNIAHISDVLFHYKKRWSNKIRRVRHNVPELQPLVSIIIPTKDQLTLLKTCLDGLWRQTSYQKFEVIVIDNQSEEAETLAYLKVLRSTENVKVMHYDHPFNYSEMNNIAVDEAQGELICFLNNDVSIIDENWLAEMVSQASRPEIGCVGAKLFYPDGTIQHAGVILGLKGYASHAHKGFEGESAGYCNRLITTQNVSAVTAACLVMKKKVFKEVGGFDAANLKVAYNDVDLCLKVREAGYRNLFTPYAQLIHHESKSRGKKRNKIQRQMLKAEADFLRKKWGKILNTDSAYNKNLTLSREDFSLGSER